MPEQPYIDPSDRPDVELSELVELVFRSFRGRIHTGMLAEVTKFDAESQTVNAQPITQACFMNGDRLKLPVINRVPVVYPQAGDYGITFPLQAGDTVWLSFSERSIEEFKQLASVDYAPANLRRFNLADAVAFPSVRSPKTPRDDVDECLNITDGEMTVSMAGGKISIGTSTIDLLGELDDLMTEIDGVWEGFNSALAAIAAAGASAPGVPVTQGTLAAFFVTAPPAGGITAQIALARAALAIIQANIQGIKK